MRLNTLFRLLGTVLYGFIGWEIGITLVGTTELNTETWQVIIPATLVGARAGVWIGICSWDYARRNNEGLQDPWSATGNALSVAAGRT